MREFTLFIDSKPSSTSIIKVWKSNIASWGSCELDCETTSFKYSTKFLKKVVTAKVLIIEPESHIAMLFCNED